MNGIHMIYNTDVRTKRIQLKQKLADLEGEMEKYLEELGYGA